MTKPFDVCIRGDGVVGRTLALLLARERLRVALVARPTPAAASADAPADVRAYALNGASRELLQTLRCWPETPFVTPVQEMHIWGDDGGKLDFSALSVAQEALAWIVEVPALEQQLIQAVRYQPHIEMVQAPVKAALSVVCEGKTSQSRQEFGVDWRIKPYPQKAIAARLQSDRPHGGVAREWFAGGDILALLPLAGITGNSVALVWSVSVERAEALEKLPPEEFCAALQAVFDPEVAQQVGTLRLISPRASWPLALATAGHWVGPGWALAGDAAHTVHPLAGQGLNLGLADAVCLAKVIAQREYWRALGDERLLRRYERARKADVAAMGAVTDGLHGLFAQTDGRWQALRNWGMKGFSRSGLLKDWITRQATGL
ncbi:FAD-dependent monooxygenase [Polaromonas sp.]|uniref:FAD-dependent monooxygenase n=1 Tax=Polaromonas sp. TaxID=1869339 RepID=UPI0017D3D190|nr:FAD-dependent monooxygenase [Polaromonas sp.]NMM06569.1 ubiquinone biosynthesis protein UbiH [Polaromonas sp.]